MASREVEEQVQWSLSYLLATYEEDNIKKKRSGLRQSLFDYIKDNGEEDERGNLLFYFDKPITVDGETWHTGLMLQRRVTEYVDDDITRQIIDSHNEGDRCYVRTYVEEIDYDEVYALNQEGVISDEEIDSILSQEESWALVKMTA